jgi:Rrf2 family protein
MREAVMIRISTRGRYALRAMVDLAQHDDDSPVGRQDIADRQAISADYLAQLFRHLQSAGLVEGVKGPGGGYRLARAPQRIHALDVVQAVEGPIALVQCVEDCPDRVPACNRVDHCVTHLLWERLSQTVADALASVTLQDLCNQARELAVASPSPVPGAG